MQAFIELAHPRVPHLNRRPILRSYDSGEECSFYHWIEVVKLVAQSEEPSLHEEQEYSTELEEALEETMSEVEPATAYQHFAGNVV